MNCQCVMYTCLLHLVCLIIILSFILTLLRYILCEYLHIGVSEYISYFKHAALINKLICIYYWLIVKLTYFMTASYISV